MIESRARGGRENEGRLLFFPLVRFVLVPIYGGEKATEASSPQNILAGQFGVGWWWWNETIWHLYICQFPVNLLQAGVLSQNNINPPPQCFVCDALCGGGAFLKIGVCLPTVPPSAGRNCQEPCDVGQEGETSLFAANELKMTWKMSALHLPSSAVSSASSSTAPACFAL